MTADDDMTSMVIIMIIFIIIIIFIFIIMLMVMKMITMMKIMTLQAPTCENALQILDTTIPQPKFGSNKEQLLLHGTMESDPPEAPT